MAENVTRRGESGARGFRITLRTAHNVPFKKSPTRSCDGLQQISTCSSPNGNGPVAIGMASRMSVPSGAVRSTK